MKGLLLRIFGHRMTLIFGDPMVLDRWRWITRYLPRTQGGELLIDIGCGSGAFSLGAAKRGYRTLGLSWDDRNNQEAESRARILDLPNVSFKVFDARRLNELHTDRGKYKYALCTENIEHIVDDSKLIRDINALLAPGGRLLLTTPNYYYRPLTKEDEGPFDPIEDGRHVRRGYSKAELRELLEHQGFLVETIEYCSGYFSQRTTTALRLLSRYFGGFAWVVTLPLRALGPMLDRPRANGRWPGFSLCAVAIKPRFSGARTLQKPGGSQ
jgi:2-polyprenyl-3-methyl-5-hydroxy-6-metoxy-1,4-benzoquinol methylase